MSEHIKTGVSIWDEIQKADNYHKRIKIEEDKWVPLSWLKEEIDKQTNAIADKPISVYDTGAWDMLRWLSKLLEEQAKE